MKAIKYGGFKEPLFCNLFLKPAPFVVNPKVLKKLHDPDLTKDIDNSANQLFTKCGWYHFHLSDLILSQAGS